MLGVVALSDSNWKGAFANINAWTKDSYTPAP